MRRRKYFANWVFFSIIILQITPKDFQRCLEQLVAINRCNPLSHPKVAFNCSWAMLAQMVRFAHCGIGLGATNAKWIKGPGCNTGHQEIRCRIRGESNDHIHNKTGFETLSRYYQKSKNRCSSCPTERTCVLQKCRSKVWWPPVKCYLYHSVSGSWTSCTWWTRTRKENPGNSAERPTSQNKTSGRGRSRHRNRRLTGT